MKSWLRSWKFCEVSRMEVDGVPGWRKHRLKLAAILIPPGNGSLNFLRSGCEMVGRGWAEHEVSVFRRTHADVAEARVLDHTTIWLPHLPGQELRTVCNPESAKQAFTELGRFHRLHERSIHGDPHAGNFLHHRDEHLCRIIDFETTAPAAMNPAQGRARDFAILALDLWKHGCALTGEFNGWWDAYGGETDDCPIAELFLHPGYRLGIYWRLLGYSLPPFS